MKQITRNSSPVAALATLALALSLSAACGSKQSPSSGAPGAPGSEPASCEAGETKKIDCNSCGCSGGDWVCTAIDCSGGVVGGEGSEGSEGSPPDEGDPNACQAGDSKKIECNTCGCSDGQWVCTAMDCRGQTAAPPQGGAGSPPDEGTAACTEGAAIDIECNRCTCGDGRWMCTARACGP